MSEGQQFIMPQTHAGSIVELTDAQAELKRLEMTMRGYYIDESGNVIKVGEPMMNEQGIGDVFGVIGRSLVNRLTVLSNFDEDEVKNQMAGLAKELGRLLLLNSKRYEIKNTTITWDLIYPSVLRVCFVCLKRGFKQGDKQFFGRMGQLIESRVETVNKGKGLSGMMPWSKE
jgi:hypothetical protein